ncbi:anion exchange 2 isoform X1, partial [Brachionus plicatilis]
MNYSNDELTSGNGSKIVIKIDESDAVSSLHEDSDNTSANNSNYLSVSSVALIKPAEPGLPRRPSIFDYMNQDSLNSGEFEDAKNYTFIKKSFSNNYIQDSSRLSQVPLLKVSKSFENTDKDESETALDNCQMEGSKDEGEFALKSPRNKLGLGEKRVEFSIGSPKKPHTVKTKPKSVLKHFSIETHSLMSQNVDEQEEYELADKETAQDSEYSIAAKRSKDLNNNFPLETTSLILENDKTEKPSENEPSQRPAGHKLNKKSKIQKKIRNLASRAKLEPESSNPSHEIYVELEELKSVDKNLIDEQIYEWHEVSRWIKYEQTIDSETNKWNRPFVGALLYQSLLYLKTGLQYGTVLLKC